MELKDKVEVTFHAGVLTIGGTIVEIAYKDSHIFFDFGTEFRPGLDLPDENLQTLLDNGLIPELKGLYDLRFNYEYKGDETKDYAHTAVFISHSHLDHTRMINYLDSGISMYALEATAEVVSVLNQNGDFLLPSPFESEKAFTRKITAVAPYGKIQVGDIEVQLVPVDHDAYGACGMIITVAGRKIAYTGDLRLHGYNPEDTEKFTELAYKADMMIMEGVSISFPERKPVKVACPIHSENALIAGFVQLQKVNPERQITFNAYPANVQRFSEMAKQSIRQIVLTADMALLLKKLFNRDVAYYKENVEQDISLLDKTLEVDYVDLLADKTNYIWQVTDNFDKLQAGGLYIHSDAAPLGDFDPTYEKFLALLNSNAIEFVRMACSGHATPDDLDKIVRLTKPQLLIPIHSYHPEKLENPYGERILPHRGQKLLL